MKRAVIPPLIREVEMSFSKDTVRKFLFLVGVLWFFAPAGAADPGAELVRESVRSGVK